MVMGIKSERSVGRARLFGGLIGIFLILAAQPLTAGCPCNYTPVTLIEVISADTLLLEVSGVQEAVHIADISAPRLESQSGPDKTWCENEGEKAIEARDYATQLLSKASEISIDEQERLASGDLSAVVYIDNVSFGQELHYKYLVAQTGETPNWCP